MSPRSRGLHLAPVDGVRPTKSGGLARNPLAPTPRAHLEEGITPKTTCWKLAPSECPSQRHRAWLWAEAWPGHRGAGRCLQSRALPPTSGLSSTPRVLGSSGSSSCATGVPAAGSPSQTCTTCSAGSQGLTQLWARPTHPCWGPAPLTGPGWGSVLQARLGPPR